MIGIGFPQAFPRRAPLRKESSQKVHRFTGNDCDFLLEENEKRVLPGPPVSGTHAELVSQAYIFIGDW